MLCLIYLSCLDASPIGWSTSIPNYNPVDIIENIRRQMKGEPTVPMTPWYRGFKGRIEKVDNKGKYICSGTARVIDSKTVEIIELPVKKWTDDYKKQLEDWIIGSEKDKTDKEKAKVSETFVKVRFYFDYSSRFISIVMIGLPRVSHNHYRTLRGHNGRKGCRACAGGGPRKVFQAHNNHQYVQYDRI